MRILIARHGETEWNRQGRVQGQGDSPLTPKGVAQAEALGEAWQELGIEELVSSTLGRAQATAAIVARRLQCPCRSDAALVEQNFGSYEGRLVVALRQADPNIDAIFRGSQPDLAPPGGESFREMASRALRAITAIAAMPAQTVGVVAHGNCIKSLLWLLDGAAGDGDRYRHINASFSELHADAEGLRLVRWGVATHLLPLIEA